MGKKFVLVASPKEPGILRISAGIGGSITPKALHKTDVVKNLTGNGESETNWLPGIAN